MTTKVRIYEMGRGKADNIQVVDKKLTLVVHNIDEHTPQVIFVANPNIVDYRATAKSQTIGFESIDESRQISMAPNTKPIKIEIDGTVYQIAVESIGTEQGARRWAYCDFVISW